MTTTNRSVIMSVFADNAQAQQAMDDLQQAGFSPDQIRYSVRKSGTGITNSLENLGLPEQEASFYNQEFEAGRTVVMVNTADRQQEAYDILRRNGGYDFNSRAAQTTGYAQTAGTAATSSTGVQETETEGEQGLKLREEQLRAQKQPVETGEARLRKDVVTEEKSIDVPVTREEVYVERRPGSGQPADQPIGEEGETYRVPVREEQVTVEKQPYVREEVAMGKRPIQETKQVSDTVRREEAHVEREGDIDIQSSDADSASG
ncbi:MAG: YsnF/AvaK domain-containing protein [Ktedonobacteraceae bacterium]